MKLLFNPDMDWRKHQQAFIWLVGHGINFHLQLFVVGILGLACMGFIAALSVSPEIVMKKAQTFWYLAQHEGLGTAFSIFYIGSLFLYMQIQITEMGRKIRLQSALQTLQNQNTQPIKIGD